MPYKNYVQTLSSPRSHLYKVVFKTQNDSELCGAVLWSQAVAASLHPLITAFEVTLRNRIHVTLSREGTKKFVKDALAVIDQGRLVDAAIEKAAEDIQKTVEAIEESRVAAIKAVQAASKEKKASEKVASAAPAQLKQLIKQESAAKQKSIDALQKATAASLAASNASQIARSSIEAAIKDLQATNSAPDVLEKLIALKSQGLVPLDSFHWYEASLNLYPFNGKTADQIKEVLFDQSGNRRTDTHPDRFVSSLSFSFWPKLLDSQLPNQTIEREIFTEVFSGHPNASQHWTYEENRKNVVTLITDVQNWRNRISHCKPIWSKGWLRGTQNPSFTSLVGRLKSRRDEMLQVLEWLCPDTSTIYKKSYPAKAFDDLVTEHALIAYIFSPQNACTAPNFPIASAATLAAYQAR